MATPDLALFAAAPSPPPSLVAVRTCPAVDAAVAVRTSHSLTRKQENMTREPPSTTPEIDTTALRWHKEGLDGYSEVVLPTSLSTEKGI